MREETSNVVPLLDDAEAWERLPVGPRPALPVWARALAGALPRTTGAMLRLDFLYRTHDVLPPKLRGMLRWIAADAHRCDYGKAYAEADLRHAGFDQTLIKTLTEDHSLLPDPERAAVSLAQKLTLTPHKITDEAVARLITLHGTRQVVAMVMLVAYACFKNTLILALGLSMEPQGPLQPLDVFLDRSRDEKNRQAKQHASPPPQIGPASGHSSPRQEQRFEMAFTQVREWVEKRRSSQPRIPIPSIEEVRARMPPAYAGNHALQGHSARVCLGYQPQLSTVGMMSSRAFQEEADIDPVFHQTLWWLVATSLRCFYCVGHCEMTLASAGLTPADIAERLERLTSGDWTKFGPGERVAFAYARKQVASPASVTAQDFKELAEHVGVNRALATVWLLANSHHSARISEAFQLPLEHENVFEGSYDRGSARRSP